MISQGDGQRSGGGGPGVRRRPPTVGSPFAPASSYGTNEEDSPLLSQHDVDGYPVLQSYAARRRYGNGSVWYRHPQKLILAATFAWVGGVLYLASLAHAVLRTHREASRPMGSSLVDSDEDFKEWLQSSYGASASDEDVAKWIELRKKNGNKYGATAASDEDYQQWLEQQANKRGWHNQWQENQANKYGASDETNEDFKQWLESQNKYGASNGGSVGGDAWEDFVTNQQSGTSRVVQNNEGYGNGKEKVESGDKKESHARLGNSDASEGYRADSGNSKSKSAKKTESNTRLGNSDAWQDYVTNQQSGTSRVVQNNQGYGASGENKANKLTLPWIAKAAVSSDLSTLSTIDWPLKDLPPVPCSGCTPSSNVTVLVVYGPEDHPHISEMAWNVASGVHSAFETHIQHHPGSPLHGHIVLGHTSNVTFSDVMDADAVIIGSPVHNANVHPDVQNWINYWNVDEDLSKKFGGAFATAGGMHAGADGTTMSILRSMMIFRMMAVGGDDWTSPFGAVATVYEDPFGDASRSDYFDESCYLSNDRKGDVCKPQIVYLDGEFFRKKSSCRFLFLDDCKNSN
ncbi:hypothetical protein ACHAXT_000399 [Thalassiosira profunda]